MKMRVLMRDGFVVAMNRGPGAARMQAGTGQWWEDATRFSGATSLPAPPAPPALSRSPRVPVSATRLFP